MKTILIIHGGYSLRKPTLNEKNNYQSSIHKILSEVYPLLVAGKSSKEAVVRAVELLENDPLFNAGTGSKRQSDGKIRMSASLMDGKRLRFSGVVNVSDIKNPIRLASCLQQENDRVLSSIGAFKYGNTKGFKKYSPYTSKRVIEYEKPERGKTGTVGAVALDSSGCIAAATSTGGKGNEFVGRVSDSPTVAGNYANKCAGVSVTGIGEHIVEHAVASSICVRVEDGMSLKEAMKKTFRFAKKMKSEFGCIGLSHTGEYWISKCREKAYMSWGVVNHSGEIHVGS